MGDPDQVDYRALFMTAPKPAWVRIGDRFIEVNDTALAQYGYSRDEFLALRRNDILIAELSDVFPAAECVERHATRDGDRLVMKVDSATVHIEGAEARLEILDDVTLDLELDVELRESEAQFRAAQEIGHIGSWKWEIEDNVIMWSDELCRIFDVEPGAAPSDFATYLTYVHPDDRKMAAANVERALATLEPYEAVYRIVHPNGEIRWLQSWGRVLADADKKPMRAIGVCQDITERKLTEDELTHRALHDALTGLPERTLFMDRLEQAIRRLDRRDSTLAVLFLDLDRFKAINDKHGHPAGDQALKTTTTRLTRILRPGDTVARFGGDEFAILCEDVTVKSASELAARVIAVLSEPLIIGGRLVATSASVGLAFTSDATTEADTILHDADAAMYEAKEHGRDRFVVFDHTSRLRGMARLRRAEEVRAAVENGELRVYFQPDIDLGTDTSVGVEALVRWQHPNLGLIGPDEFIAIAEQNGTVIALGEWVLSEACHQVAAWPSEPRQPPLNVAVNISATQLTDPGLIDMLRRVLDESGLAPGRLCLEITESVVMDDVPSVVKVLSEFKAIGVRLAVDDFGTGYSSLSYLRDLPIDVVKIDRALVAGVGDDPAADAIVAAVVNLSHALGLSVVAEGVETEEQLVAVRALGCDRGQGFYWSAAAAADDLGDWKRPSRQHMAGVEPVALYGVLAERTQALRETTGRPVLLEAPLKLGEVTVDRRSLQTIVDHLLGNAVTYSSHDRPVVVTGASDRHWIRISVADFGVGMTTEESARCFEQFWQAQAPVATLPRGTGMGLYIVRSLVERMGGHIGVRSAKGKGSTFTVALPRSARRAGDMEAPINGTQRMGEDTSIREFMRQIGVPNRRGA